MHASAAARRSSAIVVAPHSAGGPRSCLASPAAVGRGACAHSCGAAGGGNAVRAVPRSRRGSRWARADDAAASLRGVGGWPRHAPREKASGAYTRVIGRPSASTVMRHAAPVASGPTSMPWAPVAVICTWAPGNARWAIGTRAYWKLEGVSRHRRLRVPSPPRDHTSSAVPWRACTAALTSLERSGKMKATVPAGGIGSGAPVASPPRASHRDASVPPRGGGRSPRVACTCATWGPADASGAAASAPPPACGAA